MAAVLYPVAATFSIFANVASRPVSSSSGELATPRIQMAQPAHVEGEGSLVHQRGSDDEDMILKQRLHMARHWTLSEFQCFAPLFRHSKLSNKMTQ